ncbi:MAG TPA: hypothetical protein VFC94_01965, partial [Bacteroidaceae bacterium]|nr:hypothetical protein [Bacteroidaceae bacterium]
SITLFLSCSDIEPDDSGSKSYVTTEAASNLSSSGATLSGSMNGISYSDIAMGKYGVLYIRESDMDGDAEAMFREYQQGGSLPSGCYVKHGVVLQVGSKFSIEVNDFSPNQKIYYCAIFEKSDGTRYIGSILNFSTNPFNPTVETGDTLSVRFNVATLSGLVEVPIVDRGNCSFGIIWSDQDTPTSMNGHIVPKPWYGVTDGAFDVKISGLSINTTYYYRAYVRFNKDMLYYYGPVRSFKTLSYDDMAVDLGLSVKWASCNLGAQEPLEDGVAYAWGVTESNYEGSQAVYKYYSSENGTYQDIGDEISGTEYDVVKQKMGGKWRMPTAEEAEEFFAQCKRVGKIGGPYYSFVGPSGNSIILKSLHSHYKDFISLYDAFLWTGTISCYSDIDKSIGSFAVTIFQSTRELFYNERYIQHPIRPVCEY